MPDIVFRTASATTNRQWIRCGRRAALQSDTLDCRRQIRPALHGVARLSRYAGPRPCRHVADRPIAPRPRGARSDRPPAGHCVRSERSSSQSGLRHGRRRIELPTMHAGGRGFEDHQPTERIDIANAARRGLYACLDWSSLATSLSPPDLHESQHTVQRRELPVDATCAREP